MALDWPRREVSPVAEHQAFVEAFPLAGGGPTPIDRAVNKASLYGIVVDVVDLCKDQFGRFQVPVVATAALPEATETFAAWLVVLHSSQEFRRMNGYPLDCTIRDGRLEIKEKPRSIKGRRTRINQKVNVLRH